MNLPVNMLLQGGKYKIVRFIKSGGFGCTYEAEHVMLEKRIAIKEFFVKDFCNRDEQTSHVTVGTQSKKELVAKLRRKFIDEAKGLCKLHHPGIVSVSDVFEENGTAYFVMDYIEGKSLSEIVHARGALPEKQALDYIRQAGEALQYVHEHNRLHLDIKPGNLMLDGNGQVVLIDFGASKQYDEENGENTSTLIGNTPGYAPLEQMGNDVVRFMPATDVYALGATLYKLLTGTTPLSANRLASGEEQPPLPAGISQGSRMAVDRAMQTRKDKRPQSVREFLSLLGSPAEPSEPENDNTVFEVKTEVFENPQPELERPTPSPITPSEPEPGKSSGGKNKVWRIILSVGVALLTLWGYTALTGKDTETQTYEPVPVTDEIISVTEKIFYNKSGQGYKYTGPVNAQGQPHGFGKGEFFGSNGGTYVGNFDNGVRSGQGEFTTADGSNQYTGTWKDDQYDEGTLTMTSDGSYFKGTFKDNVWYTGKFYTKSGKFDGELVNGEMK